MQQVEQPEAENEEINVVVYIYSLKGIRKESHKFLFMPIQIMLHWHPFKSLSILAIFHSDRSIL